MWSASRFGSAPAPPGRTTRSELNGQSRCRRHDEEVRSESSDLARPLSNRKEKKCLADSANRALTFPYQATRNGSRSTHIDLVMLSAMSGCCRRFFHSSLERSNRYMEFSSCRPLGGRSFMALRLLATILLSFNWSVCSEKPFRLAWSRNLFPLGSYWIVPRSGQTVM
jgi:hypothetical protein